MSATKPSTQSLYDQIRGWLLESVDERFGIVGRVMESIGLDTYEREFSVTVQLLPTDENDEEADDYPDQPGDGETEDYTLLAEFRFWVNVLDELASQGVEIDLDEEQPLVLETTITVGQERLGSSAASMWREVGEMLEQSGCDECSLSVAQRYELGAFAATAAEATIMADWFRDPGGVSESYVHEIVSTIYRIMRRLADEYPLPQSGPQWR